MKAIITLTAWMLTFAAPSFATGVTAEPAAADAAARYCLFCEGSAVAGLPAESRVEVRYLLDADGRPYLISVFSEDPEWTQRFLRLLGEEGEAAADRPAFGLTIQYDHIR